ncbi:STAS/SEC14 domain-containing protein [Cypionkella sp.]|uniref:STAS/SEC14 domain-containing protein n=1 Tax=Cypionkella sp. TaxID=2811411 RepID=UPI0026375F73|nr:STAS/SEC14 domain-containing protein [Cypionkella sp.]MDB5664312.1 hypothetical protein [Cypionkella sp.]
MLRTGSINQIPVDNPSVYAFRISNEVQAEDLKAMAQTMNNAFDVHSSVSMLLIFEQYEGVETGAGFDMETFKSQFRSLAKVDKYAVVGAPSIASTMINVMEKVIPTDARTFERSEELVAWQFVGANPAASS